MASRTFKPRTTSALAPGGYSPEDIEEFRRRADELRAGTGIPSGLMLDPRVEPY